MQPKPGSVPCSSISNRQSWDGLLRPRVCSVPPQFPFSSLHQTSCHNSAFDFWQKCYHHIFLQNFHHYEYFKNNFIQRQSNRQPMYSFPSTLEHSQIENTKWPFNGAKSRISWVGQAEMIIADYRISFYTLRVQILVEGDGQWVEPALWGASHESRGVTVWFTTLHLCSLGLAWVGNSPCPGSHGCFLTCLSVPVVSNISVINIKSGFAIFCFALRHWYL